MISMRISIKEAGKILSTVVGAAQSAIGVLAAIASYILYSDLFGLQAWLNVTTEFVPLYMLILIVFGFFSVISGLFLLAERSESP